MIKMILKKAFEKKFFKKKRFLNVNMIKLMILIVKTPISDPTFLNQIKKTARSSS